MQSSRSPKDTSVKLFTSEMVGAPSLTQAAGALIDVLSACLVNGFGMQQVSSFVVTQGLGQITVPVATGWERMCVIDVAGCTDASYNGEYKLTQVSADGLRVSFPIDAPDGTVLGAAITVKLAAAGWLLRFADPATNKAVYMPGTPQWAGHCLWVEDVAGTHANVRGYESMSGVDVGLGMFPTASQVAQATWGKAFGAARPAKWLVVADDRLVYAGVAAGYAVAETQGAYMVRWFGGLHALNAQDQHAISISVQGGVAIVTGAVVVNGCASISTGSAQVNVFAARSENGASASVAAMISTLYPYTTESGNDVSCGPAAGVGVGNLVFAQKFLREAAGSYPRARMQAILHGMHTSVSSVTAGTVAAVIGGRLCRFFPGPSAGGARTVDFVCAIDVEGPWS